MRQFWTARRAPLPTLEKPRDGEELDAPGDAWKRVRSSFGAQSERPLPVLPGQIQKILVATDFSIASKSALHQSVALANQCQSVLTILHVIDINTQSEMGTAEDVMSRLWTEGFTQMGQLAGQLSGQVDAQTILEQGLPCEIIVRKSLEFDLIILGQPHPKKSWNVFSKKTVQRVIENAFCPVMIVRPEA
jgi:nucleotide-binding universal stress UspA family protein